MRYTPIEGEEWKTADGFNNALRISNKGRAASVNELVHKVNNMQQEMAVITTINDQQTKDIDNIKYMNLK